MAKQTLIKKIRPLFNQILTTAERYTEDQNIGVLINKTAGSYKDFQKVVAVGGSVREIKVGDIVSINPTKYMRKKYNDNSLREDFIDNPVIEVNIPTVPMEDEEYFLIYDNDVSFVVEDYEEIDVPDIPIITPREPKINV